MNAVTATCTRTLVALDIDGTLVDDENKIPSGTVEDLDLARAAGHESRARHRSITDRVCCRSRSGWG